MYVCVCTHSILLLPPPPVSLLCAPIGSPTSLEASLSSCLLRSEPRKYFSLFYAFARLFLLPSLLSSWLSLGLQG